MSVPLIFWVTPFYIFYCLFLPFPILHFDLIATCTVDKTKDGGVCRKRLLHYHKRKIEIVLPEKLIKKILTDQQERVKIKLNEIIFKTFISLQLACYVHKTS